MVSINEYLLSGEFIKTWNNIAQVAKKYNTSTSNICKCASGKILTLKGRIFLKDTNIDIRLELLKSRKHKSKSEYEL